MVTERLADGSYRAIIARIPGDLPRGWAGSGRDAGGRSSRPGAVLALAVPTDDELLIARDTAGLIATVAASGRDH